MSDDVFHRVSMIMNVDQAEIAKIVHDYIERDIRCSTLYDRFNSPPAPIYIGPVKIKTLKERLEEATMHEDCYFCIKRDICTKDVPKPCKYRYTEEERKADQASDRFGAILHNTYLHPTFRKKKEETKMNATSVQVINNVKDMSVTIEKSVLEETRIIISVSTDDDTYEINCSGPGCVEFLRKKDFVPIKEYEYVQNQLMEREKELRQWKKEAADCLRLRDEAQKEAYKLKKENEKLKELKTPTIENFADEEPSSRSDILDLAKKCVCGKREQDYGTPESNFQLIADLWNQYLFKEPGAKEIFGIGPMDVSMMMALMKIARIRNGGGSGDSFVDLAGYAACGGEIWHSNKETNGDSN